MRKLFKPFLKILFKVKTRYLLIASIVLMLIPFSIITYVAVYDMWSVSQKTEKLQESSRAIQNIDELRYKSQLYQVGIYQLINSQDQNKIAECEQTGDEIARLIELLKTGRIDPKFTASIKEKYVAYLAMVKPIFDNYAKKELVNTQMPKILAAQKNYMSSLDNAKRAADKSMRSAISDINSVRNSSKWAVIISIILALIVAANVIIFTVVNIINPMRASFDKIANAAQQLLKSSQALSSNSNAINQISMQISSAIEQVATGATDQSKSAGDAAAIVDQIAGAINQVATGAQKQTATVSEMAMAINQLIDTISQVSEDAHFVAEIVDVSSTVASKGKGAVEDTVSGMLKIKETVLSTANKIQALGEKSKQIGEIIEVIDDIAEQTNLLALNAAIEAARAGEHGKGFA
ncbi:MAG: methyl-accepting chemotaxis protein, partial [Actinomycetota bacterium]